jgi:ribonuclease-3
MEAVIGAIFLDGGLDPVRAFVRRQVMGEAAEQLARELRSGAALGNYKSALQEHLQATRAGIPVYKVKNESGPDHHKRFLVEVRLKPEDGEPGKALARGLGSTKKHAEQDAARRALARLITAETGQTPTATMEELRPAADDLSAGTALYADEDVPAGTRMEQGEQAAK